MNSTQHREQVEGGDLGIWDSQADSTARVYRDSHVQADGAWR